MALRRSHGYEEMDGTSHPENINDSTANISPTAISSTDHFTAQEIELTTVSVVPDGMWLIIIIQATLSNSLTKYLSLYRHIYCTPGRQCVRFWLVSSKAFASNWIMLDGRLYGDVYFEYASTSSALPLGNLQVFNYFFYYSFVWHKNICSKTIQK